MYNPQLLIPRGYGTDYGTLAGLADELALHYHPAYSRRLLAWLSFMNGAVGVGGLWRAIGTQPDLPGFAAEGKSFHQNQRFNDGFIGACAVDLVAPDGPDGNHSHDMVSWSVVPKQGSAYAALWGVHCNTSTESWHMQPIEIDGWQTWVNEGRPAPRYDYPLPDLDPSPVVIPPTPVPPVTPPVSVPYAQPVKDIMIVAKTTDGAHYASFGYRTGAFHISNQITVDAVFANGPALNASAGYPLTPVAKANWAAVKAGVTKSQAFDILGAPIAS